MSCQLLESVEEQRIATLAAESDVHPRLIRIAIDYAADHADEIRQRIEHNEELAEKSRRAAEQRAVLLN